MEPKKILIFVIDYSIIEIKNKILFPNFYNDRVLSKGALYSELLIVGLALGSRDANRTGKIFNDDFSRNLTFKFLKKYYIFLKS